MNGLAMLLAATTAEVVLGAVALADGGTREVKGVPGDLCELSVKELVCDTRTCGNDGWRIEERAPFALASGEDLELDVFIDRSVIEVFANGRQAISRRVFPDASAAHIFLGAKGGKADYLAVTAWEMDATNPY